MELTTTKNQLTEVEIKITNNLPESVRHWVVMRQEHPIKSLTQIEIGVFCRQLMAWAFVYFTPNGQPNEEILSFQSDRVNEILIREFKELTRSEVKFAFKKGLDRKYGEFFGLCPATYQLFLESFSKETERGKTWIEYLNQIESSSRAEKPKLITKEFLENAAKKAYVEFINEDKLPIHAASIYDTTKEILGFKSLMITSDMPNIRIDALHDYKERIKGLSNDLVKDWKIDDKENTVYASSLKKIGLKYFYNRMKNEGKTSLV